MTEKQEVLYDVKDKVATVTINRPERRNSMNADVLAGLNKYLDEAAIDRGVSAIVLTGAGHTFCAGADLGSNFSGEQSFLDMHDDRRHYIGLLLKMNKCKKPILAAIEGYCLAGGTDIAMLCDMIIAAESATFGFPPARDLGALPNNMWLYNVGPQWAKRLTLTGDTVTGAEAQEIGLILKAVPEDLLEQEVEGLAARMAHIDPDLLSANKRIINMGLELMGARTLQRMASENDVRGHNTRAANEYRRSVKEHGLKATLRARDAKFGDGRARVHGPELRDADGNLLD